MIELATPAADDLIVIGTSAGGLEALRAIVAALPAGLPAAVLVAMHVGQHDSLLPSLLAPVTALPVRHAREGDSLEAGRILVAPPDFHLLVLEQDGARRVSLSRGPRENHARPAIDPLFRTAAAIYGARATGVILTGRLDDGTAGLFAIKACGGHAIVQLPADAVAPEMPLSAIDNVDVDQVLLLDDIAPALVQRAMASALRGAARERPVRMTPPEWLQLEIQFVSTGGNIETLARIATPSTYTCPECHGNLWQVQGIGPRRYRCHTGHSLTERSLAELQGQLVDEALWSAIRALHEKEKLLRTMADNMPGGSHAPAAVARLSQATTAQRSGELLRRLVTGEALPGLAG